MSHGEWCDNRTGIATKTIFGAMMQFDLACGYPIVTTKKVFWHSVKHELLWFLRGEENIKYLRDNKVKIWEPWADSQGNVGPMYGSQWINWDKKNINQLDKCIEIIKSGMKSRRIVMSAWNPSCIPEDNSKIHENPGKGIMALAPCHILVQFNTGAHNKLSCIFYQRSCDAFLGLPFNIASYALLTHLVAHQVGMEPDKLVFMGGDVHIYENHMQNVRIQCTREPLQLPKLLISKKPNSIYEYTDDMLELQDYKHHDALRASIAV